MEFEDTKIISEFNEAKFQILRLHDIWTTCHRCRVKGDYATWRWALDSAAIELSEDAEMLDSQQKGEESFVEKIKELDKKIKEAAKKLNKDELYDLLVEKEKLLKKIQNLAGKGAKYKSEDEDYFE